MTAARSAPRPPAELPAPVHTRETLEHDIGVLTARLDRILRWHAEGTASDHYLLVYGGPILAEAIQLYERLEALDREAGPSPSEGGRQ